jgi:hypothetical protein
MVTMSVETFIYRNWEFWIGPARALVADRPPTDIPIAEFAPMLSDGLVEINRPPFAPIDLTFPVLVCDLAASVDGHSRLLIDGWHRLAAAVNAGVSTLPALVLSVDEGLSVSGRYDCGGCEHCAHVQFDRDDDDCQYCQACVDEIINAEPCDIADHGDHHEFCDASPRDPLPRRP